MRWFTGWSGTARPRPDSLFASAFRNKSAHLHHLIRWDLVLWYVTFQSVAIVEAISKNVVSDAHFLCLRALPGWPIVGIRRLECLFPTLAFLQLERLVLGFVLDDHKFFDLFVLIFSRLLLLPPCFGRNMRNSLSDCCSGDYFLECGGRGIRKFPKRIESMMSEKSRNLSFTW